MPVITYEDISVDFPFVPYSHQEDYLLRIVQSLKRSEHAFLEAPNGSGSTLSLLCATLGWQTHLKKELQEEKDRLEEERRLNEALDQAEKLFLPPSQRSGRDNVEEMDEIPQGRQELHQDTPRDMSSSELCGIPSCREWPTVPRIIYTANTHNQLSRAMRNVDSTIYRKSPMAHVATREHLCINNELTLKKSHQAKVHECNYLVQRDECCYYNNWQNKRGALLSEFKTNCLGDIEDLIRFGEKNDCCPYFLSRDLVQSADVLLIQTDDVINHKMRDLHELSMKNDVVIFDEGHTLMSKCEEAASCVLKTWHLTEAIEELDILAIEIRERVITDHEDFLMGVNPNLHGSSLRMSQICHVSVDEEDLFQWNVDLEEKTCTEEELVTSQSLTCLDDTQTEPYLFNLMLTENDVNGLKDNFVKLLKRIEQLDVPNTGLTSPSQFGYDLLSQCNIRLNDSDRVIALLNAIIKAASSSDDRVLREAKGIVKVSNFIKTVFYAEPSPSDCDPSTQWMDKYRWHIRNEYAFSYFKSKETYSYVTTSRSPPPKKPTPYDRKEDRIPSPISPTSMLGAGDIEDDQEFARPPNRPVFFRGRGRGSFGFKGRMPIKKVRTSPWDPTPMLVGGNMNGKKRHFEPTDRWKTNPNIPQTSNSENPGPTSTASFTRVPHRALHFWCLDPSRTIKKLTEEEHVRNIIITSCNLFPTGLMKHELQIFKTMEYQVRKHVVESDQLCVCVVKIGPSGDILNCDYHNRQREQYPMELGRALANFARIVPRGLLVFFPSFAVLQMCYDKWRKNKIISLIKSYKDIVREKETMTDHSVKVLLNAYKCRVLHPDLPGGAMFLAVAQGKMSEALALGDYYSRGVVIVGLPYQPLQDARVKEKMQCLDNNKQFTVQGMDAGKVTGSRWYQQQPWRAINLIVGRILSHPRDYGAVILCDERFASKKSLSNLPSWVHSGRHICTDINNVDTLSFGFVMKTVAQFFKNAQTKYPARSLEEMYVEEARDPTTGGLFTDPYLYGQIEYSTLLRESRYRRPHQRPVRMPNERLMPVECGAGPRIGKLLEEANKPPIPMATSTQIAEPAPLPQEFLDTFESERAASSTSHEAAPEWPAGQIRVPPPLVFWQGPHPEVEALSPAQRAAINAAYPQRISMSPREAVILSLLRKLALTCPEATSHTYFMLRYHWRFYLINYTSIEFLFATFLSVLHPLDAVEEMQIIYPSIREDHKLQFSKYFHHHTGIVLHPDLVDLLHEEAKAQQAEEMKDRDPLSLQPCAYCGVSPMVVPLRASCNHVACYPCWRKVMEQREKHCPDCDTILRHRDFVRLYYEHEKPEPTSSSSGTTNNDASSIPKEKD